MKWLNQRWPWRALALCLFTGIIVPFLVLAITGGSSVSLAWGWFILAGILVGAWFFFCVWTWRRLARVRDTDHGELIYDFGVLGWGLAFGLSMAVAQAVQEVGGPTLEDILSFRFAGALLYHGIVMFPLALWGGYFWGKCMGLLSSANLRK